MLKGIRRGALVSTLVLACALVAAEGAGAVLSGTNGRIVFVSGRDQPNDQTAKLYLRPVISSVGGGVASPVTNATGTAQHRHPTWSPDRTMIAYAHGTSPDFDIFILDLTDPNATPQNITNTPTLNEDRPAWSPDGTRIAYEGEVTNGGNVDIFVDPVNGGPTVNLTDDAAPNSKPAWSPDSQTLYYTSGDPNGMGPSNDANILKEPADNLGSPDLAVPDSNISEFQPAISPDGQSICFTLGEGFNGTADIYTAPLSSPASQTNLSDNVGIDPIHGDYNCAWSPDGEFITYVQGTFATGELVMERSDDTGGFLTLETTPNRFDGNPDWAPDGRPECGDLSVETGFNEPVSIPLECADTGPEYERTAVRAFVPADSGPANGTVTGDDPPVELPGAVTYTPDPGFTGTDTFTIQSFDEIGFGGNGTVSVRVKPDNEFTLGKVKRNKRRGTAKLAVTVPGEGDVTLEGSNKLKAASVRALGQGTVKLALRPKGRTKNKLKKKGKAKVRARVTYTPEGGDPNTKSKQIRLKRKR